MKYTAVINKSKYGFEAHCPALSGCHSQGDTLDEDNENIRNAIKTFRHILKKENE